MKRRIGGRAAWWTVMCVVAGLGCSEAPSDGPSNLSNVDEPPSPGELGLGGAAWPAKGFRLLDRAPGELFPSGLAVAKVRLVDGEGGGRRLDLARITLHEGARWNALMDALPSVRETVLIDSYGLRGAAIETETLLKKASALGCGLCLVYAESGDGRHESEVFGVLWNVSARRALSCYRSTALIVLDEGHRCSDRPGEDHRNCNSQYVATRDLENGVRESLWALAGADRPSPTTQPNPWQTERPSLPNSTLLPLRMLQGREIIIRPQSGAATTP